MTILIFVIILAVLILVHELGHFLAAKKSEVRVDEFGIGFPPRLLTLFKWRETKFSLNAIPFGGFVKIFGENPSEEDADLSSAEKSIHFTHKSKPIQAFILSAGILFNIIFAWFLISLGFVYGLPMPQEDGGRPVENARLIVTSVIEDSPAAEAGLKTGDAILGIETSERSLSEINPELVSLFINESKGPVLLTIDRGGEIENKEVTPTSGVVEDKQAIGISMATIGTLKLPIHLAFWEAAKMTLTLLWAIAVGILLFLGQAITGQADFSQVAGPVGIVGLVGDATKLGFIYLIQFTAFISLNLAVINLFPFPALDGGRLLFVLIESIKGSAINPKIANTLNAVGFILLLLLMVVITISDISKFF